MPNIDESRSYATEKNLEAALAKYGIASYRHLVVCTRTGRYTAVFPASACDGRMYMFAQYGFITLG